MIVDLPYSNTLDTRRLGRLFDNMSESYKLFWFKAIVDFVYSGKTVLSYSELIDEMIAEGWYMVAEYKLNLGPNDAIEKLILKVYDGSGLKTNEKKHNVKKYLNQNISKELLEMKNRPLLNVPYRLQAPYLDDVKGKAWNSRDIINTINKHDNLLYHFIDKKTIKVCDEFACYVKNNYEVLSGWIRFNMITYLQKRNPSVPGIVYKLDPPATRKLNHVIKYWKEVLSISEISDIYSDTALNNSDLSIDHFIPWSYVAHDELWNLIPTRKSINSSKSNNLPNWDKYFLKFSKLQYNSYKISHKNKLIEKLFIDCLYEYVNDEKIRFELYKDGQNEVEFCNRLEEIVKPVYIAAKNLGFSEWQV